MRHGILALTSFLLLGLGSGCGEQPTMLFELQVLDTRPPELVEINGEVVPHTINVDYDLGSFFQLTWDLDANWERLPELAPIVVTATKGTDVVTRTLVEADLMICANNSVTLGEPVFARIRVNVFGIPDLSMRLAGSCNDEHVFLEEDF